MVIFGHVFFFLSWFIESQSETLIHQNKLQEMKKMETGPNQWNHSNSSHDTVFNFITCLFLQIPFPVFSTPGKVWNDKLKVDSRNISRKRLTIIQGSKKVSLTFIKVLFQDDLFGGWYRCVELSRFSKKHSKFTWKWETNFFPAVGDQWP